MLKKIIYILLILTTFILPQNVQAKSEAKDFLNRNIKISKNPQRILSLTPATTEILFALGLNNRIIGDTDDCNYPAEAKTKTKVGKFGFINLEKVVALKPDIIFATSDMNRQLDILKKYNVPVIALKTDNIYSVIDNIILIGELTNSQAKAKSIKDNFYKRLAKVTEKAKTIKKPKVFYCIWHDPIMTAGGKSFIGDMIKLAGGVNIAENINNAFAKYSIESLIANNPDYIIIPNSTYQKINFNSSPWNRLKAVKEKRVFSVNEDIYLRPAPRIIDAIEDLQAHIAK